MRRPALPGIRFQVTRAVHRMFADPYDTDPVRTQTVRMYELFGVAAG